MNKNIIINILNSIYGNTKFNIHINEFIADKMQALHEDKIAYLTKQDYINIIWNNYSGGSTAEYAFNEILKAHNLTME